MAAPASPEQCPPLDRLESHLSEPDAAVLQHLESCAECRARFETVRENNELFTRLRRSATGDRTIADRPRDAPSPTIPGYVIADEIHRGGQGVVYRAMQLATSRTVAIKLLVAGSFATTRQRQRFEREIELVAALRHPHVVTVFDSGRTNEGHEYLVMEHIDGTPLDEYCRDLRSSRQTDPNRARNEIIGIFVRLCQAVNYAHQRGVMHRDLKPSNVLIDENGVPHVLDFGLAKMTQIPDRANVREVTQDDSFVGTLAYASPEQTTPVDGGVDIRTDIYAIGVMLYEALTGRLPIPIDGPLREALRRIAEDQPPAPSRMIANPTGDVDGAPARPWSIDDELDAITLMAIHKERPRRYQAADALAKDLTRYLAGEPVDAKRDHTWYLLRKTLSRHRWSAATAAAFLILLTGFAVSMSVLYGRVRTEAQKSAQIRIFLEDTLGSVEPNVLGEPVTVRETLDEAVHWVDIALEGQPEVQAAILLTIGNSYRSLGAYDRAERHVNRALTIRADRLGADHPEVAQAINTLGLIRRDQGRLDEAISLFSEALRLRQAAFGADDLVVAMSLSNVARAEYLIGRHDVARARYEEALRIRRERLGPRHPDVAMTFYRLAEIARTVGDSRQAIDLNTQALSIRRENLHADHPDLARSLLALGTLMLETEQASEAAPLLREAVEARSRTMPTSHWRVAEAQLRWAQALVALGRTEEARPIVIEAWETLRITRGAGDTMTREADAVLTSLTPSDDLDQGAG